jgi:dimeric dUTPase (all-alpha-NTP-PPase superfamily)
MLSPKTLKKLQLEQRKLDELIWENYCKRNNLPTSEKANKSKDSFIRIKVALFVEIGELANELKTFKH